MSISESTEMYLETILVLSKKGIVRSIDIANEMNFSRPTISVTVHNLETDDIFEDTYDKLILSPGAKPVIPGICQNRIC